MRSWRNGGAPGEARERTSSTGAESLKLTLERVLPCWTDVPQRTEIEAILEHYRASMNGLWGEWRPRYRTLIDSVRVQIETVLTDEQVTEYRGLLERRRGRDSGQTDGSAGGRSGADRRGESGDDRNQNDDR